MKSSSSILKSGGDTSNPLPTAAKNDTKPNDMIDFDTFINNLFLYIDFSPELTDDAIANNYLESNKHHQNNGEVKILLFAIANVAQSWVDPSCPSARSFDRHDSIAIAKSSDAGRVHSIVTAIAEKIDAKINSKRKDLTQDEKNSIDLTFRSTIAEYHRSKTVVSASLQPYPVSSPQHVAEQKTSCGRVIKKLDSKPLNKNKTNASKNSIIEKIFLPLDELLENAKNLTSDTIIKNIIVNIRELRKQLKQDLVAKLGKGMSDTDLEKSKQAKCVTDTVKVLNNVFANNSATIEEMNKSISQYRNEYKTKTSCTAKFAKAALCLAAGLAGLLAGVLLCAIIGFGTGLVTGGIGAAPGCVWGLVTGFTYAYHAVTVSAAHLASAAILGAASAGGAGYRLFRETNIVSNKVAELADNLNKAEKAKMLATDCRLSLC